MAVDRFEKRKNTQLTKAQREIDAIFKVAAQEAAAIAGTVRKPNPDKVFSFNDYPQTHARIAKLEEWMAEEIEHTISNNITEEWNIAEASGEQLTTDFLQRTYQDVSSAPAALKARYYRNNTEAHDAFLARTIKGMGLSDRVWRLTAQCKQELEMAIDIGLGDGLSAQEMSRSIRKYLKEPDKLFRRVRDKHGNLVLSKAAKAYHPGQGVYRSSYKNALRLSATEGNIAYRTADHLKWQQLDFVVGIQIGLSNNHTLNGVPFHDICDELAGRYPKDFKFTGWHPFCRCIATTILMTPEEFKANEEAFLDGKEPTVRSKNEVDDVPPQFKKWRKENADKIKSAKSLPYFVRDNEQYFNPTKITKKAAKGVKESQALNKALAQTTDPEVLREQARLEGLEAAKVRHANRTPEQIADIQRRWDERAEKRRRAEMLERARLRHEARTPEQIADIKNRWNERKAIRHYGRNILAYMEGISDVDTSSLANALKGGDTKLILTEARKLKSVGKEILGLKNINNPMSVARQFSAAEAKAVDEAVGKTFARWRWDDDLASLKFLKGKLETEISFIESRQRYSTWKVAQDAYKKRLELVKFKIERAELADNISDALTFAKTSKAKGVKDLLTEWETLVRTDAPIAELRKTANKLESKYEEWIEKQLAKKAAKAGDIALEVENFINSPIGKRYGLSSVDLEITKDGAVKVSNAGYMALSEYHKTTLLEYQWTRKYVRTANSFALNGKLDDVGGKGVNASTRHHINPLGRDRYGDKMTSKDITDIKNFDKVIDARQMPFDVELVRMIDDGGLAGQFGLTGLSGQSLKDALDGMVGQTVQAYRYLSFSTDIKKNVFTSRNVKWHTTGKKGTKCYFADNGAESEVVFGRGMKVTLKKVKYDPQSNRFEIWAELSE